MPNRLPLCPHCAYDQSGAIATWKTECPLRGVCSECGGAVEYGPLLGLRWYPPRWSFEHARAPAIVALVKTCWRCFVPRRLWRDLLPEHRPRPARLIVLAVIWLVIGQVLAAGVALAVIVATPAPIWPLPLMQQVLETLPPYNTVWIRDSPGSASGAGTRWMLGLTLWPPVVMALLAARMNRSPKRIFRVSNWHIVRGFVYLLPVAMTAYVVLLGATIGFVAAADRPATRFDTVIFVGYVFLLLGAPTVLGWWWMVFLRDHLRTLEPVRGAVLGTVLGVVSGIAVLVVMIPLLEA